MNCHIDIVFVAGRHDSFQEVLQILEEFFIINVLVHLKQFFHMFHSFRLPPRHYCAIGVTCDGSKHFLRIQFIYCFLRICKHGRAIRSFSGQLSPGPVKDRHEIIANHVNVFLTKIFQTLNVMINIQIPVCRTGLDGIMYIYTFNADYFKSGSLNLFFHGSDCFSCPHFTRCRIV